MPSQNWKNPVDITQNLESPTDVIPKLDEFHGYHPKIGKNPWISPQNGKNSWIPSQNWENSMDIIPKLKKIQWISPQDGKIPWVPSQNLDKSNEYHSNLEKFHGYHPKPGKFHGYHPKATSLDKIPSHGKRSDIPGWERSQRFENSFGIPSLVFPQSSFQRFLSLPAKDFGDFPSGKGGIGAGIPKGARAALGSLEKSGIPGGMGWDGVIPQLLPSQSIPGFQESFQNSIPGIWDGSLGIRRPLDFTQPPDLPPESQVFQQILGLSHRFWGKPLDLGALGQSLGFCPRPLAFPEDPRIFQRIPRFWGRSSVEF